MEKRKKIYLKLLNRFLKENNIYDPFWSSLTNPNSSYYRLKGLNNIIQLGRKYDFRVIFYHFIHDGWSEYYFWKPFCSKWIKLFDDFYETHYGRKKTAIKTN